MQKASVRQFYNDMNSKMLSYRVNGNLRIDKAIKFILPLIRPRDRVLEIGCGIGIVAEQLAKKAKKGQVYGVDISDKNISYADKMVKNAQFFNVDIINDFDEMKKLIKVKVDVCIMVGVINNLPEDARLDLFKNIRSLGVSKLIITYPSPEYQLWLMKNKPQELQIIDNIIELPTLISEAGEAGYGLKYFSLVDVWEQNQYVHCVLQPENLLALC